MSLKILLIGESCYDIFSYGVADRVCPEASCLVFKSTYKTENDGMAANVLSNLKALDKDLEIDFITNVNKPYKVRYVCERYNQMLMRHDINDTINEHFYFDKIKDYSVDCVIVSDYNKGYLTKDDLQQLSLNFRLSFLDTKKPLGEWANAFTFIKINESEWNNSGNIEMKDKLIVTKGAKGATYNGVDYPTEEVLMPNISGAGDTFLAGLVYNYLHTKSIIEAIKFANICSSKVVQKRGVSTV